MLKRPGVKPASQLKWKAELFRRHAKAWFICIGNSTHWSSVLMSVMWVPCRCWAPCRCSWVAILSTPAGSLLLLCASERCELSFPSFLVSPRVWEVRAFYFWFLSSPRVWEVCAFFLIFPYRPAWRKPPTSLFRKRPLYRDKRPGAYYSAFFHPQNCIAPGGVYPLSYGI